MPISYDDAKAKLEELSTTLGIAVKMAFWAKKKELTELTTSAATHGVGQGLHRDAITKHNNRVLQRIKRARGDYEFNNNTSNNPAIKFYKDLY